MWVCECEREDENWELGACNKTQQRNSERCEEQRRAELSNIIEFVLPLIHSALSGCQSYSLYFHYDIRDMKKFLTPKIHASCCCCCCRWLAHGAVFDISFILSYLYSYTHTHALAHMSDTRDYISLSVYEIGLKCLCIVSMYLAHDAHFSRRSVVVIVVVCVCVCVYYSFSSGDIQPRRRTIFCSTKEDADVFVHVVTHVDICFIYPFSLSLSLAFSLSLLCITFDDVQTNRWLGQFALHVAAAHTRCHRDIRYELNWKYFVRSIQFVNWRNILYGAQLQLQWSLRRLTVSPSQ